MVQLRPIRVSFAIIDPLSSSCSLPILLLRSYQENISTVYLHQPFATWVFFSQPVRLEEPPFHISLDSDLPLQNPSLTSPQKCTLTNRKSRATYSYYSSSLLVFPAETPVENPPNLFRTSRKFILSGSVCSQMVEKKPLATPVLQSSIFQMLFERNA